MSTPTTVQPATTHVIVTDLERSLIALIAEGRISAAIGRQLGMSEASTRKRVMLLMYKLGARDRPNLVHIAHLRGLLGADV